MSFDPIPELRFFARVMHFDGDLEKGALTQIDPVSLENDTVIKEEAIARTKALPKTVEQEKAENTRAASSKPKRFTKAKFGSEVLDIVLEADGVQRRVGTYEYVSEHKKLRQRALGETRIPDNPLTDPVLNYIFGSNFTAEEKQYLINKYPVAAILLERGHDVFARNVQLTSARRRELLSGIKSRPPKDWNSLEFAAISDAHAQLYKSGAVTSTFPFIRLKAGGALAADDEQNLSPEIKQGFETRGIPDIVAHQIKDISKFTPSVKFNAGLPQNIFWYDDSVGILRKLIEALNAAIPTDVTHALIVPWLGKGGGELVSLWHAEAISETGGVPVMIATDGDKEEWVDRLHKKATYVDLTKVLKSETLIDTYFSPDQICTALSFCLRSRQLRAIHVINSYVGFQLLKQDIDWQDTRVFVSLFGIGKDTHGLDAGYWCEAGSLKNVTAFLTDNSAIPDARAEGFGISRADVSVIGYPTAATKKFATLEDTPTLRPQILWASRLDHEKLPGLVYKIAALIPEADIHMFGSSVLNDDVLGTPPENVLIRGSFDGWPSIPNENFAALLFTSMWEGLPNVILEALGSGLPVIASNVGAIREVVREDCGILIDEVFNPLPYAEALKIVIQNPELRAKFSQNAINQIETERSLQTLTKTLSDIDYLSD